MTLRRPFLSMKSPGPVLRQRPVRPPERELLAFASHISMLVRLKILEVKGLEAIHEDVLREINFEIGRWIRQESEGQLQALLDRILTALGISLQDHPQAALQIIRTMGLEITATNHRPVIDFFLDALSGWGFNLRCLAR